MILISFAFCAMQKRYENTQMGKATETLIEQIMMVICCLTLLLK